MAVVFSTLYWGFVGITSILFFPIALFIWLTTVLFDRRLFLLHKFTCFWASVYSWINPLWTVTIKNREKIQSGRAYVIVSNHQSMVDILVLFRLFNHFKWVSKAEIFKIPVIGWNMGLNRYIKLHRGSLRASAAMMKAGEKALREGSSVYIFPEGTRSSTGKLGNFRGGAFELAKRAQVPILPIVVDGTSRALPKKGVVLRNRARVEIRVLDEVPAESFQDKDAVQLNKDVHALFARALNTENS